jgi:hypothetical protein
MSRAEALAAMNSTAQAAAVEGLDLRLADALPANSF